MNEKNKGAALPAAPSAVSGAAFLGAGEGQHMRDLRQLNFSHGNGYCAGTPIPHALFLTSNYTLVVIAHCFDCGGDFQADLPFEQLIVACPGTPRSSFTPTVITADDIAFLRALHIDPNLEKNENQNGADEQIRHLK